MSKEKDLGEKFVAGAVDGTVGEAGKVIGGVVVAAGVLGLAFLIGGPAGVAAVAKFGVAGALIGGNNN